jgi:cytochrome P450
MSQSCPTSVSNYSPFDPAALKCPHAGWALLRKDAPILRIDLPGSPMPCYLVTRRRELEYISQHPDIFSSNPPAGMWRWPELHEPAVGAAFTAIAGRRPVNTLQASDPPSSVMYRGLVDEFLSRRGVKEMAPQIEEIIDKLLEEIPSDEPINFVDAFSVRLPLLMICLIMGVPFEREGYFRHYTDRTSGPSRCSRRRGL